MDKCCMNLLPSDSVFECVPLFLPGCPWKTVYVVDFWYRLGIRIFIQVFDVKLIKYDDADYRGGEFVE